MLSLVCVILFIDVEWWGKRARGGGVSGQVGGGRTHLLLFYATLSGQVGRKLPCSLLLRMTRGRTSQEGGPTNPPPYPELSGRKDHTKDRSGLVGIAL